MTRRSLFWIGAGGALAGLAQPRRPPNVLFIPVDDLRTELGCYGGQAKTPHMDALARRGILFQRAYCQYPVCNPSRASVLTGMRPDTTGVTDLSTHYRVKLPDVITVPEHFKQHGYHSEALGKVNHDGRGILDPQSWSLPEWFARDSGQYSRAAKTEKEGLRRKLIAAGSSEEAARKTTETLWGPLWLAEQGPDNESRDGALAEKAIERLEALARKDQPFFLAAGFKKPHVPYCVPARYFDLYSLEEIRLPTNLKPPADASTPPNSHEEQPGSMVELRLFTNIFGKGKTLAELPASTLREATRAYLAASSFADAQIGRVLSTLERLGLAEKTIVVLFGDNGYHLGEHGRWGKAALFEESTRCPLIISAPGAQRAAASRGIVEFVDIYPTLCELAGLRIPDGLEGISMAPLLKRPGQPWKVASFSQMRGGDDRKAPARPPWIGKSVRTSRYRYNAWADADGQLTGEELFDLDHDPGENQSIAGRPETKAVQEKLRDLLRMGWKGALPRETRPGS